jgi:iron complex outermembrane receptor protein
MNDEKQPGFATDDLSMSYQFPAYQLPAMKNKIAPKIQLNLYNLTNTLTRSGVYQYQFNAKDATGTSGNIISASGSPTYYVEPNFAAVLSISTPF